MNKASVWVPFGLCILFMCIAHGFFTYEGWGKYADPPRAFCTFFILCIAAGFGISASIGAFNHDAPEDDDDLPGEPNARHD